MIDADDVGDAFWWGGIPLGILFLVIYLVYSVPEIEKCEKPSTDHPQGGIMVKDARGHEQCIDKNAMIAPTKASAATSIPQ
jgi:hypothetical protein